MTQPIRPAAARRTWMELVVCQVNMPLSPGGRLSPSACWRRSYPQRQLMARLLVPLDDTGGQLAAKPYLGWSSWSLESTNYPGVNTNGSASWLTEQHVLQQ